MRYLTTKVLDLEIYLLSTLDKVWHEEKKYTFLFPLIQTYTENRNLMKCKIIPCKIECVLIRQNAFLVAILESYFNAAFQKESTGYQKIEQGS